MELRDYFDQLCKSLGALMINDPAELSLTVDVDESRVNADISVSLGLIVTELVINALKHAFPGERGGAIIVDFHAMGKSWKPSAGDDGVGTTAKLADAKPGLGTSIVAALADQLDVTVTTENGEPGTKVSIVHDEPTGRCHNDKGFGRVS
ncbi:sensor histidine kinase [Sphingopyxis sp. PAMC25046]|nr:sensor histidine kinase [Sphingopyxis sp. PAMC25046]